MPIGIQIISTPFIFTTAIDLDLKVMAYFNFIEGDYHLEAKPVKDPAQTIYIKVWDRGPEPPTFTGLTFYLGFNSRDEFSDYEANDEFAAILKRGRLQIEIAYEKKLHLQSPSGGNIRTKNDGLEQKTGN